MPLRTFIFIHITSLLFSAYCVASWTFDQNVLGMGSNMFSELGIGTVSRNESQPVAMNTSLAMKPMHPWIQVSASGGGHQSAFLSADGIVHTTGWNIAGGLGDGTFAHRSHLAPVDTSGVLHGKTIVQVSVGSDFIIFLDSDGVPHSVGGNMEGELCMGEPWTNRASLPVDMDTTAFAGKKITKIFAGTLTTFLVDADGKAYGCGTNLRGELGTGSSGLIRNPSPVPLTAFEGKQISHIAAGFGFTIFLTNDGIVSGSGFNNRGQLGIGPTSENPFFSPVAMDTTGALSGKTIIQVEVGHEFTVLLSSDGMVFGCGASASGQIGAGSIEDKLVPVAMDRSGGLRDKKIAQIAVGYDFTLLLSDDGLVFGTGKNRYGVLGIGSEQGPEQPIPVAMDTSGVLKNITIKQIAAGGEYALLLSTNGEIFGVGGNEIGSLGDWSMEGHSTPIDLMPQVSYITGSQYTSFIDSEGRISGVGYNADGNLGTGDTESTSLPKFMNTSGVLSGKTITQVSSCNSHQIILTKDGKVFGTGKNSRGSLGTCDVQSTTFPVPMDMTRGLDGMHVVQVSSGFEFTIVLTSVGTVFGAGLNDYGQLGIERPSMDFEQCPRAMDVNGQLSGKIVTQIATGFSHTIVLDSEGSVYSCGDNTYGQLAQAHFRKRVTPQRAVGLLVGRRVRQIAAGSSHTIYVDFEGKVFGSGANTHHQLGIQDTSAHVLPVAMEIFDSNKFFVVRAACGYRHTILLDVVGNIYGVGSNLFGELGLTPDTKVPQPILLSFPSPCYSIGASNIGSFALCKEKVATPRCAKGFYLIADVCHECPPGSRCEHNIRTLCESGTYSATFYSTQCFSCPLGSSSPTIGASSPMDCKQCAKGTYAGKEGSTSCDPAPAGAYVDTVGASAYIHCPLGTYSTSVGATEKVSCVRCPRGHYCPEEGSTTPIPCPHGKYRSTEGAINLHDCDECEMGFACPNATSAMPTQPCSEGTYPIEGMCVDCLQGHECVKGILYECQPGTWSSPGRTKCEPCDEGFYCPMAGSVTPQLEPCPPGHFCDVGSAEPQPCHPGSYSNDTQGQCTLCPTNHFSPNWKTTTQCAPCADGTHCRHGSTINLSVPWKNDAVTAFPFSAPHLPSWIKWSVFGVSGMLVFVLACAALLLLVAVTLILKKFTSIYLIQQLDIFSRKHWTPPNSSIKVKKTIFGGFLSVLTLFLVFVAWSYTLISFCTSNVQDSESVRVLKAGQVSTFADMQVRLHLVKGEHVTITLKNKRDHGFGLIEGREAGGNSSFVRGVSNDTHEAYEWKCSSCLVEDATAFVEWSFEADSPIVLGNVDVEMSHTSWDSKSVWLSKGFVSDDEEMLCNENKLSVIQKYVRHRTIPFPSVTFLSQAIGLSRYDDEEYYSWQYLGSVLNDCPYKTSSSYSFSFKVDMTLSDSYVEVTQNLKDGGLKLLSQLFALLGGLTGVITLILTIVESRLGHVKKGRQDKNKHSKKMDSLAAPLLDDNLDEDSESQLRRSGGHDFEMEDFGNGNSRDTRAPPNHIQQNMERMASQLESQQEEMRKMREFIDSMQQQNAADVD